MNIFQALTLAKSGARVRPKTWHNLYRDVPVVVYRGMFRCLVIDLEGNEYDAARYVAEHESELLGEWEEVKS